jgi:hypothetical protein
MGGRQAAPHKTSGYSQIAYIDINPPILEPAMKYFPDFSALDNFYR